MKFNIVKVSGEWHLVAGRSPAEKKPSILSKAPGWPTREQAEQAARENAEKAWLEKRTFRNGFGRSVMVYALLVRTGDFVTRGTGEHTHHEDTASEVGISGGDDCSVVVTIGRTSLEALAVVIVVMDGEEVLDTHEFVAVGHMWNSVVHMATLKRHMQVRIS